MADKETLENAIRVIEDAGGFVMMQGDLEDHEKPLTHEQMDAIEAEERQAFEDYQDRKKQAFKEFDRALGSKNFSMGTVSDICYENGIDLDDIEEYIHNHF